MNRFLTATLCALAALFACNVAHAQEWGDVSTRRLSTSDLRGASQKRLDLLRNYPYARHGLRFDRPDLRDYFGGFDWYQPDTDSKSVVEGRLSRRESANVALIARYQRDHRGDTGGASDVSDVFTVMVGKGTDGRYLSRADVADVYAGYGSFGLTVLRNVPYARHGYRFDRDDLRRGFGAFAWYQPDTSDMNVVEHRFNDYEKANIASVRAYEKRNH